MRLHQEYIKSVIFGTEDSLVSTTGLLAGISIGASNTRFIVVTGIIAILIEAVSMGVSEYLSDDAVKNLNNGTKPDSAFLSGLFLMCAYIVAGMVPLLPMAFLTFPISLGTSIVLALAGLYLLGYVKGKVLHTSPTRGAFKIFIIGGITALLGIILGFVFRV